MYNNARIHHCVMNRQLRQRIWCGPTVSPGFYTFFLHSCVQDRRGHQHQHAENKTTTAKGHILIKFLQNNRMASSRVTFRIKPWFPLRQFPYMKPYWKVFNIKARPLFTVRGETGSCTICQSREVFSFSGGLICFRFAACLSILLYKSFQRKFLRVIANLLFPLNTKKNVRNGTKFHTRGYRNVLTLAMRSLIPSSSN
jgi:hypothetical protein